ncbi:hypothetical protein LIER_38244 [Lithospermum erythrorhizon]|uniref:Uncharacterized protein n=1 Tax=Lithospermum erythrorhizon TaxID=34254 RepID=A0AAV3PZW8_LITER
MLACRSGAQCEPICEDLQRRPPRGSDLFSPKTRGKEHVVLREAGEGDLLLAEMEIGPTPSKVNYKAIVSGASLKQRVLGSKASEPITPSSEGQPEESTSDQGVKDVPEDLDAPVPEEAREEPLDSSPIHCIWHPGMPSQDRPPTPRRSPNPPTGSMPIISEEGYKSDHPYIVDTPYRKRRQGRWVLKHSHLLLK